MEKKTILVTGGLGYIGSHTVFELFNKDFIESQGIKESYEVIIIDNCSNSNPKIHKILEKLTGGKIFFYQVDLCDYAATEEVFKKHKIDRVIHFAALKSVFESNSNPMLYYDKNLISSINLLKLCNEYSVNNFIFSSSCCTYGEAENNPSEDETNLCPINPYGKTKLYTENMIKDLCKTNKNFKGCILRYCNVVGAHPSGEIGESPKGTPSFLFPIIGEYVRGKRNKLYIFGNDYPTRDGTCIRDYIHVRDTAQGHLVAMKVFLKENEGLLKEGCAVYNLGTNHGYSVKEVFETYQKVNNIELKFEYSARRAGDAAVGCPKCEKIERELGWRPKATLEDICRDAYNFIKKNPEGILEG